jgi:hypothetical protein
MSGIEDNKIIARRWIEFISEHRIEDICEMTAPTWKMHGGLPGSIPLWRKHQIASVPLR